MLFDLLAALTPTVAYAADIGELIGRINRVIINPVIILLFVLAAFLFLVGVVEFVSQADNEEIRDTGKRHMVWGLIGIAIMVSVFGIMSLLVNTFNLKKPAGGSVNADGTYKFNSTPLDINSYRGKLSN